MDSLMRRGRYRCTMFHTIFLVCIVFFILLQVGIETGYSQAMLASKIRDVFVKPSANRACPVIA